MGTRGLSLVVATLATALVFGPAMAAPATDADTKAEFVERFARFVTWPADAFPADDEPFVIGVVGSGDVSTHLRRITPNRKVRGHAIRLVDIDRLKDLTLCHLVFIEESAAPDLLAILEVTATRPILTVGDSAELAGAGVLITFVTRYGELGFSIDTKAVARTGLRFSSKLLRLGLVDQSSGG